MKMSKIGTNRANTRGLATLALTLVCLSVIGLVALHFLSSEFAPSWHMVSEYAYGEYGLVLSVFFFCWGAGAIALGVALLPWATKRRHRLGAGLVMLSGIGAVAGGVFDVRHPFHGLAFGLGVPTLPIGALLVSGMLANAAPSASLRVRILAHATWVSILGMAVSMALFITSLKAAGAFHPESHQVLMTLPEGVTSVSGYANRLLVLAYLSWIGVAGGAIRSAACSSNLNRVRD